MYLKVDFSEYRPWSGAKDTWERIQEEGLEDTFESLLDDAYPEGMTMTELNDLLWFEPETVYEWLGIEEENDDEIYNSRRIKSSRHAAKKPVRSSRRVFSGEFVG